MSTVGTGKERPKKRMASAKKTGKKIVGRGIKNALPKPGLKGPRSRIKLIKPEPPSSFMARRVINITWQGQKVEALEGRFAYRFKSPAQLDSSDAQKIISSGICHCSELDTSGVGIL